MPGQYAKGTEVSIPNSMMECTRILDRYGVETYTFGSAPGKAGVEFVLKSVPIRLEIPLPPKPDKDKEINPKTGYWIQTMPRWEQAKKEAWRALVLLLKSNLEAVERGIITVEQAFMAFLVLPGGSTLGNELLPRYRELAAEGRLALPEGDTS